MSRSYELSSPVYAAIEAVAIETWASGGAFSQSALSRPIAEAVGREPERVARALAQALRTLKRRDQYIPQRARCGAKMEGSGLLTSPYAFNFTGRPIEASTLRHALSAFLLDAEVPDTAKRAVRSALRFGLGLSAKCTDDVLLAATDRVPPTELYAFPSQVHDMALRPPATLDSHTAKNYRTALRRLLRYAGKQRLLPLIFPRIWASDAWEAAKDRYFPLAEEGPTRVDLLALRGAWSALAQASLAKHGENGRDPSRLTREMAEESITYLQRVKGRHAKGYKARSALTYVAQHYGEGPFAEPDPADEFDVETPTGRRAALYLRGPQGEAGSGDWEAFLALVRANGLPDETIEFLTWYREYMTLNARDIRRQRERFPARRGALGLSGRTLSERILALRALMGAAIHPLEVPSLGRKFGLQVPPSELTPTELFGHRFQAALTAMETWWDARAAVLPSGASGKSATGALRQIVIGCGMVSLALYERLRHQRRLSVSTRETESGNVRLNAVAEEAAQKTPDETVAWEAYREANALADALAGETQPGRKARRTRRKNDFRNIEEIIRTTPPSYWIALQEVQLARMRATAVAQHASYQYHALVLNTLLLGLLISTGCRIEELCHVRLDVQFTPEDQKRRRIRLRAQDRKNSKDHTVLVQPAFVPDDLLSTYLNQTRPWFIARYCRKSQEQHEHPFLLVSTSGRPYGCLEESEDGTNRDESAFARRTNQAGRRFTTQMAMLADELGMTIPGKYMAGPHTVRAACGYGVFLLRGLQAAAHYLGDTEKTTSDFYSNINGEHVDSTCLRGLVVEPRLSNAAGQPEQSGPIQDDARRIRELEVELAELKDALAKALRPISSGRKAAA